MDIHINVTVIYMLYFCCCRVNFRKLSTKHYIKNTSKR